jgi:hypothetical protein
MCVLGGGVYKMDKTLSNKPKRGNIVLKPIVDFRVDDRVIWPAESYIMHSFEKFFILGQIKKVENGLLKILIEKYPAFQKFQLKKENIFIEIRQMEKFVITYKSKHEKQFHRLGIAGVMYKKMKYETIDIAIKNFNSAIKNFLEEGYAEYVGSGSSSSSSSSSEVGFRSAVGFRESSPEEKKEYTKKVRERLKEVAQTKRKKAQAKYKNEKYATFKQQECLFTFKFGLKKMANTILKARRKPITTQWQALEEVLHYLKDHVPAKFLTLIKIIHLLKTSKEGLYFDQLNQGGILGRSTTHMSGPEMGSTILTWIEIIYIINNISKYKWNKK